MNQCIKDLFADSDRMRRLTYGLPQAFERVALEVPKGNPAVGILREHVLTGFFINEFGKNRVEPLDDEIKRGFDLSVCDHPLSIKTVTGSGEVKVLWTVDPLKIGIEISRDYKPDCDIFLVNIYWGKERDSIFYIPVAVQTDARKQMGDDYLKANVGTNHRGIAISRQAMTIMKSDSRVRKQSVRWHQSGIDYKPHDRWEDFWRLLNDPTQTPPHRQDPREHLPAQQGGAGRGSARQRHL